MKVMPPSTAARTTLAPSSTDRVRCRGPMGKAPRPSRVTVRSNWGTKRVSNIGSILL